MTLESLLAALKPDHNNQAAYTGRIIQKETFVIQDIEGNDIHVERDVLITWNTIKELLELIKDKAQ